MLDIRKGSMIKRVWEMLGQSKLTLGRTSQSLYYVNVLQESPLKGRVEE